jgi:hypothetical protein
LIYRASTCGQSQPPPTRLVWKPLRLMRSTLLLMAFLALKIPGRAAVTSIQLRTHMATERATER